MIRLLALALVFALTLVSGPAFGVVYYFSQSDGDDADDGLSEVNAKQTMVALEALFEAASPGDEFLLKRGDTWTTPVPQISQAQGTLGNEIIFGAYGAGAKPRFFMPTSGAPGNEVFFMRGSGSGPPQHLIFRDFRIECDDTVFPMANRYAGIVMTESFNPSMPHHITFDGVEIVTCRSGFSATSNTTNEATHIVWKNGFVQDMDNDGSSEAQGFFFTGCTSCEIIDSEFDDNGRPSNQFDHNIYISSWTNGTVSRNDIHGENSGLKIRKGDGVTVEDNDIYDVDASALTLGGSDGLALDNVTVNRNRLHDTTLGINVVTQAAGSSTQDGLTITNNVIYDISLRNPAGVAQPMVFGSTSVSNALIAHNTLYCTGGVECVGFNINFNPVTNVAFNNNIMSGNPTNTYLDVDSSADLTAIAFDGNLCEGTTTNCVTEPGGSHVSLAAFNATYPTKEPNGVDGDPLLTNPALDDYTIPTGSPAKDAGVSAGILDDFLGNTRPFGSGPDIGAYEFGAGSSSSTVLVPWLRP